MKKWEGHTGDISQLEHAPCPYTQAHKTFTYDTNTVCLSDQNPSNETFAFPVHLAGLERLYPIEREKKVK